MKKIISYSVFFILLINVVTAQEFNKKYFDKRVGSEVLIDECNRSGLEEGTFGEIFANQYSNYNPNITTISNLKTHLNGISIKIVFGSWCYDSKVQVPKFFKVLDQIQFDAEQVLIIGVDRMKKPQKADISEFKIKRVPTFIIYKNKVEIGRITERPKDTLEKDLLQIIG